MISIVVLLLMVHSIVHWRSDMHWPGALRCSNQLIIVGRQLVEEQDAARRCQVLAD